MIGFISGRVLFSDGSEALIFTPTGVGYQVFCRRILPEGENVSLFISHVIRENREDFYGFSSLREKKLFELVTTVKGVGPKSAFHLVSHIPTPNLILAIQGGQKKDLTQAPGVGLRAASQVILDLQSKIQKIKMYSDQHLKISSPPPNGTVSLKPNPQKLSPDTWELEEEKSGGDTEKMLEDTLLACQNLGFQSEHIVPLAQKILRENSVKKTEQLVHLVLKEI